MRKWMRERLSKRRGKKPNPEAEATGRVGQERPSDPGVLPPLVPRYAEELDAPAEKPAREPRQRAAAELAPAAPERPSRRQHAEPAAPAAPRQPQRRMEMETQPESPSAPPDIADKATGRQPDQQKERAPKGVVVLAIGLPGSGKSTWFKRRGVTPLSSDLLRTILFDDITEQRYQSLVFSTLRSLLRARLIAKMPWNYVDATNLSPHERRQWIKMSKSLGYEVQAVYFDVPLEVCLERNRKRERVVPEDVMQRMAHKLRPPTFEEGFSKIVVVRVKDKSDAP
jgi:predicted kinase